jgi:hypothetical protein
MPAAPSYGKNILSPHMHRSLEKEEAKANIELTSTTEVKSHKEISLLNFDAP